MYLFKYYFLRLSVLQIVSFTYGLPALGWSVLSSHQSMSNYELEREGLARTQTRSEGKNIFGRTSDLVYNGKYQGVEG